MTDTRASLRCFGLVFTIGFVLAPIGDHCHVSQGVTEYFTEFGPIWLGRSPLWFAFLVAGALASLAVIQGRLAARAGEGAQPRVVADAWLVAAPALSLGLYLLTAFYPWRSGPGLELVMTLGALGMWLHYDRTKLGAVVGVVAALICVAAEWVLMQLGVFRYLPGSDELLGVGPFLLPLYFAASVGVGAIGRRMLAPPVRVRACESIDSRALLVLSLWLAQSPTVSARAHCEHAISDASHSASQSGCGTISQASQDELEMQTSSASAAARQAWP